METHLHQISINLNQTTIAVRFDSDMQLFHVIVMSAQPAGVLDHLQTTQFRELLQSILNQSPTLDSSPWKLSDCSLWYYDTDHLFMVSLTKEKTAPITRAVHQNLYDNEFDDWWQIIDRRKESN